VCWRKKAKIKYQNQDCTILFVSFRIVCFFTYILAQKCPFKIITKTPWKALKVKLWMAENLGGSWTGSDWLAGGSLDAGEDCLSG